MEEAKKVGHRIPCESAARDGSKRGCVERSDQNTFLFDPRHLRLWLRHVRVCELVVVSGGEWW